MSFFGSGFFGSGGNNGTGDNNILGSGAVSLSGFFNSVGLGNGAAPTVPVTAPFGGASPFGGAASPFGSNLTDLMQNFMQPRENPLAIAKGVEREWKLRAGDCLKYSKMLITSKKKKLDDLCSVDVETDESATTIVRLLDECDILESKMNSVKDFITQPELLTVEQVRKIANFEIDLFEDIMGPFRQEIIDAEEKKRKKQQLLNELFEKIENLWESGKPETDIIEYIKTVMADIYPNLRPQDIERLSHETLRLGTAHLPAKRNRLSQEQIDSIPSVVINSDYLASEENQTECVTCRCEFVEGDIVKVLPCDPRHVFHPSCITPWFERKTTCPYCKKDMKDFLEPEVVAPENTPSDTTTPVAPDAQPNATTNTAPPAPAEATQQATARQLDLLNQFLQNILDSVAPWGDDNGDDDDSANDNGNSFENLD